MHLQIRTVPATSPPDLEAFLGVLAEAGINLLAVGGGDVELGGELAIGVDDDDVDAALLALLHKGYRPRLVEVDHYFVPNESGQLLEAVRDVRAKNRDAGRVIKDVAVGAGTENGVAGVHIQVYSEAVGSA